MSSLAEQSASGRPVLVAPDKFKGTFQASEVATAICAPLKSRGIDTDQCPIADGGDGTLDAILSGLSGARQTSEVRGPLGHVVSAEWGLTEDSSTAIVEVAQAIGLRGVKGSQDAWAASSYGAGQLIAAAIESGAKQVLIGVGGTATTDGGAGAIDALHDVGFNAPPRGVRIVVLCDVRTPWELAAPIYAPQKGADAQTVSRLAQRLDGIADSLDKDPRGVTASGAGGGLSGRLWSEFGAELKAGGAFVLDTLGFTGRMLASRAVITGEGKLDHQTLHGKAVGEVATRCRQAGVPCHALVGQNALPAFEQRLLDIESVHETPDLHDLDGAIEAIVAQLAPS